MSSWNLKTEVGDRGHKYDFLELDGLDGQMIFSKFIVEDNLIRGMQRSRENSRIYTGLRHAYMISNLILMFFWH